MRALRGDRHRAQAGPMPTGRFLRGFVLLLLTALSAPPAGAHARLDRATPAPGSTVHVSPLRVELRFTERLEPAFSKIRVFDPKGNQIDKGDLQVSHTDAKVLQVSLPQLATGTYQVKWRVLSVDTHVIEGQFVFTIKL